MLLRSFALAALTTLALSACSSDDPEKTDGGVEGSGGSSDGAGGKSSAGGKAAAGGAGTGGAAMPDCDIDYEGDSCKTCLAEHCCDAVKECMDDETCATALDAHIECAHTPNADGSECFSTFARAISPTVDGGQPPIGPLLQCIIASCAPIQVCSGPSAF